MRETSFFIFGTIQSKSPSLVGYSQGTVEKKEGLDFIIIWIAMSDKKKSFQFPWLSFVSESKTSRKVVYLVQLLVMLKLKWSHVST